MTSDTPISSQEHFRKRIATQIESAGTFHRAEEYHQQNLEKRGRASCVIPADLEALGVDGVIGVGAYFASAAQAEAFAGDYGPGAYPSVRVIPHCAD